MISPSRMKVHYACGFMCVMCVFTCVFPCTCTYTNLNLCAGKGMNDWLGKGCPGSVAVISPSRVNVCAYVYVCICVRAYLCARVSICVNLFRYMLIFWEVMNDWRSGKHIHAHAHAQVHA